MPTFNLIRNARVFVTTNVGAGTGVVATSGFTATNSQELTVLDGFSFSQTTNQDTIQVSEAGATPTRGQRAFNTSLNPVEFSFSTYVRPFLSTTVKCDEDELWNALFNNNPLGTAPVSITATGATYASASGEITITGTALTVLPVGSVYHPRGFTGVGANQFNSPFRVKTSSATQLVATYLTAPTATLTAPTTLNLEQTSWVEHAAVAADTGLTTAYSEVTAARSNVNQLVPFGLVVTADGVTYVIDNCALDQAQVDFGLDGIATIQWSGKGTVIRQLSSNVVYSTATDPVLTGGLTGTIKGKTTSARYITNKLSTVTLAGNIGGGGTSYNVALTGGSITIANNINYITPTNLGVVNTPIGYFVGTRSITGSLTAYLRTGTGNTAELLNSLLNTASTTTETKFALNIAMGGSAQATRLEFYIPGCSLQIPTIDAQAVMSTNIAFTAQGTDNVQGASAQYDLENTNDIRIRYFSN